MSVTRRLPVTTFILSSIEGELVNISKRSIEERLKTKENMIKMTKSNIPSCFIEKFLDDSITVDKIRELAKSRIESDLERVPITTYILPEIMSRAEKLSSEPVKEGEEQLTVSRIFSLIIESNKDKIVMSNYEKLKEEMMLCGRE